MMYILDAPVVSIELGQSFDSSDINMGHDVYFDCIIDANPPVNNVQYKHNVRYQLIKNYNFQVKLKGKLSHPLN